MGLRIIGLQVENLRGFRSAALDLDRPLVILVGPNNSGKTSLLRLLDWALNQADEPLLTGGRELLEEECELLIPARDTRGGARRLVLRVDIADGRRRQRFNAVGGTASLRFRIRNKRVYLNVRRPTRSEPLESEPQALALLTELRSRMVFKLIPAFRDVASSRFRETLTRALHSKLQERALHQVAGGAPGEYRRVAESLRTIREVGDGLVQPLWDEMRDGVFGLAREGVLQLHAEPQDLVTWMASKVKFTIATGEHDVRRVAPVETGSGLQSLLDLAVLRSEAGDDHVETVLAIEEPEAFLHPSAQRTLARTLLRTTGARRVISTHSPILVDEANYGDVFLVRDHRIFPPREAADAQRSEINTRLLSGQGAEAVFSRSVLLVEGPGDKSFFDTLRRRVAPNDDTRRVDELAVVAVGSKTSFGPWIRLLESFHDAAVGEPPVEWLVVADAIDAISDVRRALRDAGITVGAETEAAFETARQAQAMNDDAQAIETARALNELAKSSRVRIQLLPIDLEWCALQNASKTTIDALVAKLELPLGTKSDLLRLLGSKHGQGAAADPRKEPWLRSAIAAHLPWSEVSRDAKDVLSRWLINAGLDDGDVKALLRRA